MAITSKFDNICTELEPFLRTDGDLPKVCGLIRPEGSGYISGASADEPCQMLPYHDNQFFMRTDKLNSGPLMT